MEGVTQSQFGNPSILLAEYFSQLSLEDVPPDVIAEAKRFVLDLLSCTAAAAETEIGPLSIELAQMLGTHRHGQAGGASVSGAAERFTIAAAAYANGRLGNSMDFDEGYPSGVHFGCGAFAAALAIAEAHNLSGREFLLAVIAGYELGGRISEAGGAYLKVENGKIVGLPDVWGIATCVVFAAVGAAAKAKRFDAAQMMQAFGVAGASTPIPIGAKWSAEMALPNTKYCDTGWCTLAGVFGVLSAEAGSTGIPTLMDGERGLFRMTGILEADTAAVAGRLGERWLLRDIVYKPWPCCRWIHYTLTALSELLTTRPIDPSDIVEVVVETNPCAMSPRFLNPDPSNFVSRQFSFPHAIAMRLLDIPPGALWLSEGICLDAKVRSLRERVKVVAHPHSSDILRDMDRSGDRIVRRLPSAVTVRTAKDSFRSESDYAWGDPWNDELRWGDAEMAAKVAALMPHADVPDLLGKVASLETQPDIDFIAALLRSAKAGKSG